MRILKGLGTGLLIILLYSSIVFAGDAVFNVDEGYNKDAWSVFAEDSGIGIGWRFVTGLGTTYAQLSSAGTVEVLLGTAASVDVTFSGIDNDDEQIKETRRATTTVSVSTTKTFKYLDQVLASPESASAMTIQKGADNVLIVSIPIGECSAQIAQHFSGEKYSYITGWGASLRDQVDVSQAVVVLRYYPSQGDSLDMTDGYRILDRMYLVPGFQRDFREFSTPIKCGKKSWIAVFASCDVASAGVNTVIQGYDSKR